MENFVNVSVRIKPNFSEEITNSSLQVINKHPPILLLLDKSQTYHFDNIFEEDLKQEDVYNESVKSLVGKVKSGYNCTVFAYGQTGTGKSFTIGTNPDVRDDNESGLIPRTLKDFFLPNEESNEVELAISFIEIYNEKVFDLLTPGSKAPLPVKGFQVQGFQKVKVCSVFDGLLYLKNGSKRRHTGETKQNINSSRSHAIFSIYCRTVNCERETMAKLNLVDLAGSESVKKTGNQGYSFYEGVNINKGLLSLGQVMTALATNSVHIPYRQSIITTILQDSLNKKNFVSLIACVSSNSEDLGETLQTLEFSNRVKRMKNKPEVNEFITQYKKENPTIFTNSVLRGMTPSKRSNRYSHETPFKKPKIIPPIIQELSSIDGCSEISPLFSSSMTSAISETPQNFSPVIKKYMKAIETSIISKIEDMIGNSIANSAIRSLHEKKEDKENVFTPRKSQRQSVRNSKISSRKIYEPNEKVYAKTFSRNNSFAESDERSSRYEEQEKNTSNHSPHQNHTLTNMDVIEEDSVFKVPALVNKTARNVNVPTRRSIRLQNRIPETKFCDTTTRRRSNRLQKSQNINANDINLEPKDVHRRRSVRIQSQKQMDETNSPCANCSSKKVQKLKRLEKTSKDSPVTSRTKQVLDILNNGRLRDLEKLHTVGSKTAEKIEFYRRLKGKFTSISDIEKMPYWTKKKYEKFLSENFLI